MDTKGFEYALENNRLRSWVRDLMEVRPLRKATEVGAIPRALHIACGGGRPTRLLLKRFAIDSLSGIDRDPSVIAEARSSFQDAAFEFSVGCVLSLDFPDDSFDAAFDLADLHNYPDWRRGLLELRRVLKPGGLLIAEELTRESFEHAGGKIFKRLTEHPYDSMLRREEFRDFALRSGFEVLSFEELNPLGLLRYVAMVARKAP